MRQIHHCVLSVFPTWEHRGGNTPPAFPPQSHRARFSVWHVAEALLQPPAAKRKCSALVAEAQPSFCNLLVCLRAVQRTKHDTIQITKGHTLTRMNKFFLAPEFNNRNVFLAQWQNWNKEISVQEANSNLELLDGRNSTYSYLLLPRLEPKNVGDCDESPLWKVSHNRVALI